MTPTFVERPNGTGDWHFMLFHHPVALRSSRTKQINVATGTMMFWSRWRSPLWTIVASSSDGSASAMTGP